MTNPEEHPSFIRARNLSEPLRSHFPKSVAEAQTWRPIIQRYALGARVLVVAQTRIECMWAAYIGAVPGWNHFYETTDVLISGAKLDVRLARILFPEFDDVPYAQ